MKRLLTSIPIYALAVVIGLVPCLFVGSIAQAKDAPANGRAQLVQANRSDDPADNDKGQLTGHKLKMCQQQQASITSRLQHMSTISSTQLEIYHEMATKTEDFYTNGGYSIATYQPLVAEVHSLYATASATVQSTEDTANRWSCNGNAKQDLAAFKDSRAASVETLNAYRQKVRELIVLVKSAATPEGE